MSEKEQEMIRTLRAELEAAERRAALLSEASSILVASSLDFRGTIRSLARLAVSRLADWCVIETQGADGRLRPSEVAHRDPRREEALVKLLENGSADLLKPLHSAVATGSGQVLEKLPDALWRKLPAGERDAMRATDCMSALVVPLQGRGRTVGAMLLVSTESGRSYDETDLEIAEELGRRAAFALDNALLYREAQEANRAKADFLAVISHELRTPLNAIMGYTDLLDAQVSGPLTEKQHGQLGRIRLSARHLLQLIEEILSYARMESGNEEVALSRLTAGSAAEAAAAVVEPLAHAKGLTFQVDVRERDVELHTDGAKLRQILVNLLSNAVKFTERGAVGLRFRREGEVGIYEVHDTGVGIPREQHDRIFDPFWQGQKPNTRRIGGTGLGLSVSRRFTRLLGGELTVESEPGRGSVFRLRVPLEHRAGAG